MKKYLNEPLITTGLTALVLTILSVFWMLTSNSALKMAPVLLFLIITLSFTAGLVHKNFKDKKDKNVHKI